MNARRFFGANSREALREVKRNLGADAAIVSNRTVNGGVEIVALAASEVPRAPSNVAMAPGSAVTGSRPAATRTDSVERGAENWAQTILAELKSVRGALEDQLAGIAWADLQRSDPVKTRLMRELLYGGVSPYLARQIAGHLPANASFEQGARWIQGVLARNLLTAADDDIIVRGGVYALMGPTGVGKTTTTAKLAARCVVRHGAEKLALLTTDSYRIGGHEQLRIFGKIMGVPVHVVPDGEDLKLALRELKHKHLVLIDTVGVGQRDQMVAEQVAMLGQCGAVNRVLLLSAAASADNLEDVVRAYRGDGLFGAIVTKVDEAVSLGAVLDVLIRYRLAVHYIANGQRVPEDLHPANREALVARAMRARSATHPAHALDDAEVPLLLALARRAGGAETTALAGARFG